MTNIEQCYKKEMNDANITQETVIKLRNIHHMYDEMTEEQLELLNNIIEMLA